MTRQQAGVSAEAVAKLVAKWREEAGKFEITRGDSEVEAAYYGCASELEAAPPEQASFTAQQMLEAFRPWAKLLGRQEMQINELLAGPADQPQAASAGALSDAISYFKIEAAARFGVINWRNKPHNEKWWKKIDGTPIPNDLIVCVAEEISRTLTRTLAAASKPEAAKEKES